jgi:RimJ/RimL family protein N-acetyltransferase
VKGKRAMKKNKIKLLPPNYNKVIKGKNVSLFPFTEDNITERYLSWLNAAAGVSSYLEIRHKKQTVRDACEYINGLRKIKGCDIFAIFTNKEGVHIGNISVTPADNGSYEQGTMSYGILIGDKNAQKMGLGAEASILIIDFLFRDPHIRRLLEGVLAKNYRSWRTLDMLGFTREGVLRKHSKLASGGVCDLYLYGMLKEEWKKNRKKFAFIMKYLEIAPWKDKK